MVTELLLISHFIGDFYLQSNKAVIKKQQNMSELLWHGLLYLLAVAVSLFISTGFMRAVIALIIISVSHLIIDWLRIKFDKKAGTRDQIISFFIDQALHIAIILLISYSLRLDLYGRGILDFIINSFGIVNIEHFITYILIYLVMIQPAAVTVKKVLTYIQDPGSIEEGQTYNAGYLIGILERIITVALILNNQIATIGFVLAAKSIARFNQLNDKDFAEKYLVGTLTSIAIAMLVTLALKKMFL